MPRAAWFKRIKGFPRFGQGVPSSRGIGLNLRGRRCMDGKGGGLVGDKIRGPWGPWGIWMLLLDGGVRGRRRPGTRHLVVFVPLIDLSPVLCNCRNCCSCVCSSWPPFCWEVAVAAVTIMVQLVMGDGPAPGKALPPPASTFPPAASVGNGTNNPAGKHPTHCHRTGVLGCLGVRCVLVRFSGLGMLGLVTCRGQGFTEPRSEGYHFCSRRG